jgi:hypothetical protein
MSSMSSMLSRSEVIRMVEECSRAYSFDSKEALRMLNLNENTYPLPFNGSKNEDKCNGIVKNHGLYTQCEKKKVNNQEYCKSCEKNRCGDIDTRVSTGLFEFKDKDGKSPKRYTEVLKKLKIEKELVEEYVKNLNIKIDSVHFEESENIKRGRPKTEKAPKELNGKKGRPKKEKKMVEIKKDEEEDLFATLIANANKMESVPEPEPEQEAKEEAKEQPKEEAKKKTPTKKVKELDPAKEADKLKKAEEKAAKEAEKLKKAEEKAAKEAEKLKKAEEKAAKEAEKLKKAEEKAAKEAEKLEKAVKEEEPDRVKKIEHDGKSYYKSKKSGVIYNMDEEIVGKWNEEKNSIDFEVDEEEEEEYDD